MRDASHASYQQSRRFAVRLPLERRSLPIFPAFFPVLLTVDWRYTRSQTNNRKWLAGIYDGLSREVRMAKCKYCGAETILYVSGNPLCVNCSDLIDAGKKPPAREESSDESEEKHAT
jgi:hypothetical protein